MATPASMQVRLAAGKVNVLPQVPYVSIAVTGGSE